MSVISPLVDNTAAQSVTPAVELTCSSPDPSGSVEVEVYPGATLTGYADCTVSNPTIYQEKIQIQVQADGLAVAAPGTIIVGAGGEEDFQVTVRADSRMTMSSRQLTVTATVTEANGAPPPNIAESQSNLIINILQFAEFNIEMEEAFPMIEVGQDAILQYKIYNTGNWLDRFLISIESDPLNSVEFSLPIVAMEVDSWSPPSRFRVELRAPSDGSHWPLNSDGIHTMEMEFDVTVDSEFSCRYEGKCSSMTLTQKIIFFQNQTVEPEPETTALSSSMDDQLLIYGGSGAAIILLLIMFLAIRRRK